MRQFRQDHVGADRGILVLFVIGMAVLFTALITLL